MNPAETGIADQSLITRRAENSRATGYIQPEIDHPPCALHGAIFRRKDFQGPLSAMVNARGPVLRDPLEMWPTWARLRRRLCLDELMDG